MARTNTTTRTPVGSTFQGGPTFVKLTDEQQLERSVLTCLLWEKEFYQSGTQTADRIKALAQTCSPEFIADLAVKARGPYKLRHAPLWLLCALLDKRVQCLVDYPSEGMEYPVTNTICDVVQRPDEMAELISLYWRNGKKPLPAQLKKGLAKAFGKFSEYQLAKNDRPGAISVRDVMFMCHPKPANADREALYKRIANNEMKTPDTWETQLSAGADPKETFIRLIGEQKLGALALLRNLRKMQEVGVHKDVIRTALLNCKVDRVLPFQFITAARHAKQFEPELEKLMFKCLADMPKLKGTTTLLLDHSGSMARKLSDKSELTRYDAAKGLAMLLREVCEDVRIFKFGNNVTEIPPRRGFALADALGNANCSTRLGHAVEVVNKVDADRLIVLTDEQTSDRVGGPRNKGYMVNVATYEHTVGYENWTRIAGWSEAVVDFILTLEAK